VSPKTDLIGTSVADEDEKMIRSLEWFRAVDGQWDKICELGAWLYRKFFGMLCYSLFQFPAN
jgi:nuclear pore complex protein Nup107